MKSTEKQRAKWRISNKRYYEKNKERSYTNSLKWCREARRKRPHIQILTPVKIRAKNAGLPFDLTKEWAEARYTGRCELSGIPFEYNSERHWDRTFSLSVDRIIPELGYIQSNCRFILCSINMLKGNATDEDIKIVIKKLYEYWIAPQTI